MKIYFNDTNIEISVSDNSYRYRAIKGDHNLTLYFSLAEHVEIPIGAYCVFQNETYTLEKPENLKMLHSRNFEYTVVFESSEAKARKYKFRNPVDRRLKFSLTATPREHLQMFIDNMNERDSGWSIGQCIDAPPTLISYNHAFCMGALSQISDEFKTEYEFAGKEVSLWKVEYNKDNPLALSYGKGNGFKPGVGRSNFQGGDPLEILYVQGGERSIDASTYGSKELLLPISKTILFDGTRFEGEDGFDASMARSYVTDADGLSIRRSDKPLFSKSEDSLDCSEIYPSRVGTVSDVIVVNDKKNSYDIIDNSVPESLNFTDCLIKGETMTIIFQTGMLAGKEFDVIKYCHTAIGDKAARRFEIVPQDIDGQRMPNDIFKPVVSDKYTVFNCMLPDAYICDDATKTGASWDMFRKAVKYLYDNEDPKFTFTGQLDGIWAKKDWLNIGGKIKLGGMVEFSDERFQTSPVLIRIIGIKDYINNPHSPEIELSNSTVGNSVLSDLRKIESNEVHVGELHREALQFTKRRFRNSQETIEMLGDAMLDNFTGSVSPIAVQTMALLVGDESLQFRFVSNMTNPEQVEHNVSYNGTTKVLTVPAGIIQHMTHGITAISSNHAANEYKFWTLPAFDSPTFTEVDKKYYLYAKVSDSAQTGVFRISETAISMYGETGYYHLLIGVLNSEFDGERSYVQLYGYSEVLPGRITTDRIVSSDGRNYVDFINNAVRLGNNTEYISYNENGDRKLKLRGTMVQSPSGDQYVIPCWRGDWSNTLLYYVGDEVTYDGSSYRCIVDCPTAGIMPVNLAYWKQVAAKGQNGTNGADGSDVIPCGRWESAKTPYQKNSVVTLGRASFMAQRETAAPPVGLIKSGDNYLTSGDGYIMCGPLEQFVNNEDWIMITPPPVDGAPGVPGTTPVILELVPSVNIVHQDKNGGKTPEKVSCRSAVIVGERREVIGVDAKIDYPTRNLVPGLWKYTFGTATHMSDYTVSRPSIALDPNTDYYVNADVEVLKGSTTSVTVGLINSSLTSVGCLTFPTIVNGKISSVLRVSDPDQAYYVIVYNGGVGSTMGNQIRLNKFAVTKIDCEPAPAPENYAIKCNGQDYTSGTEVAALAEIVWSLHKPEGTQVDMENTTLVEDGKDGSSARNYVLDSLMQKGRQYGFIYYDLSSACHGKAATVTLSFDVTAANAGCSAGVAWANNGNKISDYFINAIFSVGKMSATIQKPAEATQICIWFNIYGRVGNLMLTEGADVVPWQASPEDTAMAWGGDKNYLRGARYDNVSCWRVPWLVSYSVVPDTRFGHVVRAERISGAGEFQTQHNLDKAALKGPGILTFSVVAKPLTSDAYFNFGGWSHTYDSLNSGSKKIDLGDGWYQYYSTFYIDGELGDAFGLNSITGSWLFYGASVSRGTRIPDIVPASEDIKMPMFQGLFVEEQAYYNNTVRQDVVKYDTAWYRYIGVDGQVQSSWNSANWEPFGASFESVATDLFLAKKGYIENLIVNDVKTKNGVVEINDEKAKIGNSSIDPDGNMVFSDGAVPRVLITKNNINPGVTGGEGSVAPFYYYSGNPVNTLVGGVLNVTMPSYVYIKGTITAGASIQSNNNMSLITCSASLRQGTSDVLSLGVVSVMAGLVEPSATQTIPIDIKVWLPEGSYQVYFTMSQRTSKDIGSGNIDITEFRWEYSPDVKQTFIGSNGYATIWNLHNHEITAWDPTRNNNTGALVKTFKGVLDMPGVLAKARVTSTGLISKKWGKDITQVINQTTGSANKVVRHNLGNNNYTAIVTPVGRGVIAEVIEETAAEVQIYSTGGFNIMLVGEN